MAYDVTSIPLFIGTRCGVNISLRSSLPHAYPSCSSISGVCLCVPTPYAFILSLTSQKRLATFAPLPAPLVPLLASMIIVSGLIIPSFTSGYNVRIDVVTSWVSNNSCIIIHFIPVNLT